MASSQRGHQADEKAFAKAVGAVLDAKQEEVDQMVVERRINKVGSILSDKAL